MAKIKNETEKLQNPLYRKIKAKSLGELKMLKTALNTLIAYDLHQDVLINTEELVAQEIEKKKGYALTFNAATEMLEELESGSTDYYYDFAIAS